MISLAGLSDDNSIQMKGMQHDEGDGDPQQMQRDAKGRYGDPNVGFDEERWIRPWQCGHGEAPFAQYSHRGRSQRICTRVSTMITAYITMAMAVAVPISDRCKASL